MKWSEVLKNWEAGKFEHPHNSRYIWMTNRYRPSYEYREYSTKKPDLPTKADSKPFAAYLQKGTTAFWSKDGETRLIIPSKGKGVATLFDFKRGDKRWKSFWQQVAREVRNMPLCHVSVHGYGVAYLHVRLEMEPKYFASRSFYSFKRWTYLDGALSNDSGKQVVLKTSKQRVVPGYFSTGWMRQVYDVILKARDLRQHVYFKYYAFPDWVIGTVRKHFQTLMLAAVAYYHTDDDEKEVRRLAQEREPVNIAQERLYDVDELERLFGWRVGYYQHFFDQTGQLAPNFAVYTPTFLDGDESKLLHVINVIGFAFDSYMQPDYQYFVTGERQGEIQERLERIFRFIYRCAEDHQIDTVVMSLFGCANFASKFPGNFQTKHWMPAFRATLPVAQKLELKIRFMGADVAGYENMGKFPDDVHKYPGALFVNAWDPFSLPGNGNGKDASLDGYVGRHTNIALNGSLMLNPWLQFRAVE